MTRGTKRYVTPKSYVESVRISSLFSVSERLTVTFDGPAIEDHSIDAAVFGEALLALSSLIHEGREIVLPDGPRYSVRVQEAGEGSFNVQLLVQEFWDAVVNLFATDEAQALGFLLALFGRDGLLGFLIWLQGKTPRFRRDGDGRLIAQVEDRETVIEGRVGDLYMSAGVRRQYRKLAGTISDDQIENVTIRVAGNEPIEINAGNRPYLTAPADDEKVTDEVTTVWLRPTTVRFETERWAFRESVTNEIVFAKLVDEAFLGKLRRDEVAVRAHDSMHCRLRIEQWDRDGQIETERSIVEVLDHITGETGKQVHLEEE